MYENDYGTVVEPWKVALIHRRAKKRGFRRDEMADVEQQIVLAMADFRFDPTKANGAKEKTILTALIDRQLSTLCRARVRRERTVATQPVDPHHDECIAPEETVPQDGAALVLDVRDALGRLPSQDREICMALAAGESIDEIAHARRCSWHTVKRRIDDIRQHFEHLGLDGWICG